VDECKPLNLGLCLDQGVGVAAPDYQAAADWYKRGANAGDGEAALNLAAMYAVERGRAWQIIFQHSALIS
jgi:TPR repeat protein